MPTGQKHLMFVRSIFFFSHHYVRSFFSHTIRSFLEHCRKNGACTGDVLPPAPDESSQQDLLSQFEKLGLTGRDAAEQTRRLEEIEQGKDADLREDPGWRPAENPE